MEMTAMDNLAYNKLMELIEEDKEYKKHRIDLIIKSIECLPPKCKEIFMMSKFEGYTYNEISESLNLSIKTVETQMGRAFSIIRSKVKGYLK